MPTHNNEEIVKEAIQAVFNQQFSKSGFELIVVDDNSTDRTVAVLQQLQKEYPFKLVQQSENKGPAAARNVGINEAKHEVVFFIQDDIILTPNCLNEHFLFHLDHPADNYAQVGYVTWSPEMEITPFMYWLEHGGPQFDYQRLKHLEKTDYLAFYTPNLSLKRNFLLKHNGFDESIRLGPGLCAYEDTELGWRLFQDNMCLIYNRNAVAYHYDEKNLASICKRRYAEGQIIHQILRKHPDFKFYTREKSLHSIRYLKTAFIPERVRQRLARLILNRPLIAILEPIAAYCEKRVNIPILFKIVTAYYYHQGYLKEDD